MDTSQHPSFLIRDEDLEGATHQESLELLREESVIRARVKGVAAPLNSADEAY